jgi:hypothetical protein
LTADSVSGIRGVSSRTGSLGGLENLAHSGLYGIQPAD